MELMLPSHTITSSGATLSSSPLSDASLQGSLEDDSRSVISCSDSSSSVVVESRFAFCTLDGSREMSSFPAQMPPEDADADGIDRSNTQQVSLLPKSLFHHSRNADYECFTLSFLFMQSTPLSCFSGAPLQ